MSASFGAPFSIILKRDRHRFAELWSHGSSLALVPRLSAATSEAQRLESEFVEPRQQIGKCHGLDAIHHGPRSITRMDNPQRVELEVVVRYVH